MNKQRNHKLSMLFKWEWKMKTFSYIPHLVLYLQSVLFPANWIDFLTFSKSVETRGFTVTRPSYSDQHVTKGVRDRQWDLGC
jgi:hypothetical protein